MENFFAYQFRSFQKSEKKLETELLYGKLVWKKVPN